MNLSKLFETQAAELYESYPVVDIEASSSKRIELSQGKFAIVDSSDYERVNKFKWYYAAGYARRNIRLPNGKRKIVFMHRELMQTPEGFETDHINGNGLDNRRSNLRIVTKHENQRNAKARKGTSQYKGVTFYKSKRHKHGYWVARIQVDGKVKRLGYFKTEIEAAKAYNLAAMQYYGEYAKLNELRRECL